jgi:predicted DNA-binding protein
MGATEHISVRISPELKEKIAALAKADRRTISQWVALRLEEVVEEMERKQSAGQKR